MPWTRTPNAAMVAANWSGWIKTVPNCSPQQAFRIALKNPNIRFFFFCREAIELQDPPRSFNAGDAVFFTGKASLGGAPQCDSYQKEFMSVAYISDSFLASAGRYTTSQGLPAVDVVCIVANINLVPDPKTNAVRLAPNIFVPPGYALACGKPDVVQALQSGAIAHLQSLGITVLLTFLNNWDDSGWSEFKLPENAMLFANQLQSVVTQYGLDGIDIDDEFASSTAPTYNYSLAMVTSMMRAIMPDKIISKALFSDSQYFGVPYNGVTLEQTLTYGWEMSYGLSADSVLPPYVTAGMSTNQLSKGYDPYVAWDPSQQESDIAWMQANGDAGVMICPFPNNEPLLGLGQLVNLWMGDGNWNPYNLFTAYLSNDGTDNLLVCSSSDGNNWTAGSLVNQTSTFPPSMAVFNGALYMAFVTGNNPHYLVVSSSLDGQTWNPVMLASGPSLGQPALAVFNNQLYLAFIDSKDSLFVCSSTDGVTWTSASAVNQSSSAGPALAVFNNTLYMAFVANNTSNSLLVCSSTDGVNWTPTTAVNEMSAAGPALVSF